MLEILFSGTISKLKTNSSASITRLIDLMAENLEILLTLELPSDLKEEETSKDQAAKEVDRAT